MKLKIEPSMTRRADGTWAGAEFHCYADGEKIVKVWVTVEFDGKTAFVCVNGGQPLLIKAIEKQGEDDGAGDSGAGETEER